MCELEQVVNYFNIYFVGLWLDDICVYLLCEICEVGSEFNCLLVSLVELVVVLFVLYVEGEDVLVSGQINLMVYFELVDLDCLCELFEVFQKKNELFQLMEVCVWVLGVCLFIGEELGFIVLDGCSVVMVSYGVQGRVLGVIGVIGLIWMVYEWVIFVVQVMVGLFSDVLNWVVMIL